MGQTTIGILFGVREPADVVLRDDEYDAPIAERGLLDRWEHECEALIDARRAEIDAIVRSTPGKAAYEFERADSCFVPDTEYEGGAALVGFWVIVGASGKAGIPYPDEAVPLDEIATTEPYAAALKNARERWERFTAWAATQSVTFPAARMWLTHTEVA